MIWWKKNGFKSLLKLSIAKTWFNFLFFFVDTESLFSTVMNRKLCTKFIFFSQSHKKNLVINFLTSTSNQLAFSTFPSCSTSDLDGEVNLHDPHYMCGEYRYVYCNRKHFNAFSWHIFSSFSLTIFSLLFFIPSFKEIMLKRQFQSFFISWQASGNTNLNYIQSNKPKPTLS